MAQYGTDDGKEVTKKLSKAEAAAIVKEARERIQQSWEADKDNRTDAASDLKFLAGDQWPDAVRLERENSNPPRPMLTINRLPQFLRQVTNPIREADLSIKVSPVDDGSDPQLAKVYNGLLKQIQYQSSAKAVYAAAGEHQSGCGIGWFRITTQYVDDAVFDQEIRLKGIPNPLAVYDDPAATEPDRSDAMWRAVVEIIPTATFKLKYPKAGLDGMDVPSDGQDGFFWQTTDGVRVAEYWRKVPIKKMLALLPNGQTVDVTTMDQRVKQAIGVVRERECETFKIECYLVSGSEVLEGPMEWPGKYIPIVPVIGSEIPLDSKTYRYGLIRFARDSQQLYNFNRTAAAESMALAPKAPYLVTPEQIGEFKSQWDTANSKNRPYLLYKPDPLAPNGGRPTREHPPEIPAAYVQEALTAAEDMKATTGIYDAALGARSNETSGIAINRRLVQGDMANYHYADNLARSLEYAGRIIIDLIPKIYDNERVIRILGEDDQEEFIPINQVIMGQDGMPVMMNDLSMARFDVRVTIGPSAMTRRMETANSLIEFMKAFPESAPFVADLVAKNSDFEGADEIAKRLHNMVPPEALVDPDDPNSPQPPNPMDDPMVQAQLEKLAAEIEKIKADTAKAKAGALESLMKADEADGELGIIRTPAVVAPDLTPTDPVPQPPQRNTAGPPPDGGPPM